MSLNHKLTITFAVASVFVTGGCATHPAPLSNRATVTDAHVSLPHPTSMNDRKALADAEYRKGSLFSCAQQLAICTGMGDRSAATEIKLAACYQQLNEPELAANQLLSGLPENRDSLPLRSAYLDSLLSLGDFEDAGAMCRTMLPLLSSLSSSDKLLVARGLVLSGNPSGLDAVLSSLGPSSEAMQLKAQALMLQGNPAEAVKVLQQLMSGGGSGVWTTYLLAGAFQLEGNNSAALKYYLHATAMQNCPVDGYAQAALMQLRAGRAVRAGAIVSAAPQSAEYDPAIWQARTGVAQQQHDAALAALTQGYMYFHSGDPWRAEKIWRSAATKARGNTARALYTAIFDSAFARHARNTALHYVDAAAKRWPANVRILKDQAEIWLSLNNAKGAEQIARRLRTLVEPRGTGPIDELICRAALDAGDGHEVQQAAIRDETEEPNSALPYLHDAEYLSQNAGPSGGSKSILKIYQTATEVDSSNPQAWVHIGELKAAAGDTTGAVQDLLKALNLDMRVNGGDVSAQLSALYSRLGMAQEAHYEDGIYHWQHQLADKWQSRMKLMRTGKGTVTEWRQLGGQALDRHDNWVALCAFQRVLRANPNDTVAWGSLAAVWKRLGQFNYALGAMQKAARLTGSSRLTVK